MNYLVIPEITEHEEVESFTSADDGRTVTTVIKLGTTATELLEASVKGQHLPLVVLATDGFTLALDDVYVTGVQIGSGSDDPYASVTFSAQAVRFT